MRFYLVTSNYSDSQYPLQNKLAHYLRPLDHRSRSLHRMSFGKQGRMLNLGMLCFITFDYNVILFSCPSLGHLLKAI